MREILFRGKQEYSGEWIFGSLHIEDGETDKNGNKSIDYRILGMRGECDYVIPETVGQFTGLTDKNGKRIFEGDIIKHDFGEDQIGVQYAVVEYSDKYAAFLIKPLYDWMFCDKSDCEVIGNIHDNPELTERRM